MVEHCCATALPLRFFTTACPQVVVPHAAVSTIGGTDIYGFGYYNVTVSRQVTRCSTVHLVRPTYSSCVRA